MHVAGQRIRMLEERRRNVEEAPGAWRGGGGLGVNAKFSAGAGKAGVVRAGLPDTGAIPTSVLQRKTACATNQALCLS